MNFAFTELGSKRGACLQGKQTELTRKAPYAVLLKEEALFR
jgi:hypothetical protein